MTGSAQRSRPIESEGRQHQDIPENASIFGVDPLLDGSAFHDDTIEEIVEEEAEFICSKSLFEGTLGSGQKRYEAWLLYSPDEPRSAKVTDYRESPQKRRREDDDAYQVDQPIMDIVLLDDT
eukprot:3172907-Karenia_brevis.AAC.1